jgi:hypothetical protein
MVNVADNEYTHQISPDAYVISINMRVYGVKMHLFFSIFDNSINLHFHLLELEINLFLMPFFYNVKEKATHLP